MWGESLTQQPLCAEPVLSPYQVKLKSPISSACNSQRLSGERCASWGTPQGSQCTSGAERRVLEQSSPLTPSLPFCISLQDNQELRTTKHPATRLCQEPSPALHVSAGGSCPLFPLLPVERRSPKCPSERAAGGKEDADGEREGEVIKGGRRKSEGAEKCDGLRCGME